jgi:hypothetical protein
MKILLIAGIITVLATTGCIRRGGHGWHGELKAAPVVAETRITLPTVATPRIVEAPAPEMVVAAR